MTDLVRRLVSGNKARFKDEVLDLELDLVYLTDQIIIMGYPAEGVEGLYRNRREDAKKFLEHRHRQNFWVFNFCPVRENSYSASLFGGRVSRYPFPDHHAPPLVYMPLVARETRAWLSGSPDRVAVFHCKAGKGRSGTMACTYLLSLDDKPSAPKLQRSYSTKEWAKVCAEDVMGVVPGDEEISPNSLVGNEPSSSTSEVAENQHHTEYHSSALNTILNLHTSRRMKRPASPSEKAKQGVSIPSQQRWLYYWALMVSHTAPSNMVAIHPLPSRKVRLTQITLRMRPTSATKAGLARAASAVLERTKGAKNKTENGRAHVWASLARYDDTLIEELEKWERRTRNGNGHIGVRRPGSEHTDEEDLTDLFRTEKWDKEKMVKTFARMGALGDAKIVKEKVEGMDEPEKIYVYTMSPLTSQRWDTLRNSLEMADKPKPNDIYGPASETSSLNDVTQNAKERGVVLNAEREVRIKLYMEQVFMGWLWLIPTFHMSSSEGTTKIILRRKELDFPLGLGSTIVDVEIELEWVAKANAEVVQPLVNVEDNEETKVESAASCQGNGASS